MKIVYILILTIINLYLCCKDPQKITFLPPFNDAENFGVNKGEDIVIVCCHPDGADYLKWEDYNQKIISYKSKSGIFSLKDEKNRLILRIDNINITNAGTYKCKHDKKLDLTKSISITLKDKTLIPTFHKVELYFPKNRPIKIECPLKDQQSFKSWLYSIGKNNIYVNKPGKGTNYEITEDKLSFTIMENAVEPIKVLWCQYQELIDNQLRTGFYEFKWILYDPIDPKIELENELPILEGQEVNLICTFKTFPAQAVIFPVETNTLFQTIDQSYNGKVILKIPKITKDLEKIYQCKVTKFLSTVPFKLVEETASLKIDVVVPPYIIKPDLMKVTAKKNEQAYLKCMITGRILDDKDVMFERFSKDDAKWIKVETNDDKYQVTFDRKKEGNILTLTIKDVQWEDRGLFQCTAINAAGKDKKVGFLKVEKLPVLYTPVSEIYMAMKPVQINCFVSGYPIRSEEEIQLRVINQSSPIVIRLLGRKYDEMDGIQMSYEVAYQKKLVQGATYVLECFYFDNQNKRQQNKNIKLKIASQPDIPKVSVLCSGSSGVAFQIERPHETIETKIVTKDELFFAPSTNFDSLTKKSSRIIQVEKNAANKSQIYVLENLKPYTNYSFRWDSYNSFQFSNSLNLSATTKKLQPPSKPKSLRFLTTKNIIIVIVDWDEDCPYKGANAAIRDVYIKMKKENDDSNIEWNWVETNFTMDVERKRLEFPIFMDKPQLNYEIEVTLRSALGNSEPIIESYQAKTVLAGSLFTCFPKCSGQNLFSSFPLLKCAIIAYLLSFLIL